MPPQPPTGRVAARPEPATTARPAAPSDPETTRGATPEAGVRKIAVLRANALGDFLFSLPALDALRAAYPGAEIVLLGAPWHEGFLSGRPGPVDRVMVTPPLPGIRTGTRDEPPGDLDGFLSRARKEEFDLAIQMHGGGRHSNPLVASLGARLSVGLRAEDAPELDRWLRYVYYQPEVFRYLELVGLVGAVPRGYEPRLVLTGADRVRAARLLDRLRVGPHERLAALHPGVSDPRRRWPAERFAAVGDALAGAGVRVLVTGTGAESDLVAEVIGGMREPALAVVDEVPVGGLAALFEECRVVVANDTGPLHLAAAAGAGTVGVYWVGNMINGAPVTRRRHRPLISWTLHCPVCGLDCTRDIYPARTGGGRRCPHTPSFVADVPVAEVTEAALGLLET